MKGSAEETLALLSRVPGGQALLDRYDGKPNFGDAEILSLMLDRSGASMLSIKLVVPDREGIVTFVLRDVIDVSLRGFSHQNVIDGLTLRSAGDRTIEPWEQGVGLVFGEIEIELAPCFGAYGTIRATVAEIRLDG